MPKTPRILDLPEYVGLAEARSTLSSMVEEVQEGEAFVIKSPKGKALMVGLEQFRELQKSYLELEGRLAAIGIVENGDVRKALEASFENESEAIKISEARERYLSDGQSYSGAVEEGATRGDLLGATRADLLVLLRRLADEVSTAAAEAAGNASGGAAKEATGKAAEEAAEKFTRELVGTL